MSKRYCLLHEGRIRSGEIAFRVSRHAPQDSASGGKLFAWLCLRCWVIVNRSIQTARIEGGPSEGREKAKEAWLGLKATKAS